jgi:transposase-like protein
MPEEEKKDKQDNMIEILKGILKWIKVTSIPSVKKLLEDMLPSDEEKIAYHYSDGRGSQEVSKFAGVSFGTITRWWKTWMRAGIAEPVGARGGERARRIFSLEDFGIEVPEPKETKLEKKEVPKEETLTQGTPEAKVTEKKAVDSENGGI